jgi:hypothetical protein
MSKDYSEYTKQELRNLYANNLKHKQTATVLALVKEMYKRGMATKKEFAALDWNQDRVAEVMFPFVKIAQGISDNERTAYTVAGGKRIGRPKSDPERFWIDTYSAIKKSGKNAVFVCYVKGPGDEPDFQLYLDGVRTHNFSADQLTEAQQEWQRIADSVK